MKQKTKNLLKIWILAIALLNYVFIFAPHPAHAAINSILSGQICEPDNSTAGASTNIARCVNNIYTFAMAIGGFIGVLMFVLAGYYYAQGGNENVTTAKSYINSTLIGLVLLFGTYALLNLIDPNLTSLPKITTPGVNCGKADSNGIGVTGCDDSDSNPFTGGSNIPDQVTTQSDSGRLASPAEGATNVVNRFDYFSQLNTAWANIPYTKKDGTPCTPPNQSTIGTSGCGPSAMAMVLSYYNRHSQLKPDGTVPTTINPATIADLSSKLGYRVCGSGTAYAMFPAVATKYGLKAETTDWAGARRALLQGYPVIAAMGPGYFTSTGHFVVLYSMTNSKGEILTLDPNNGLASGTNLDHVLISDSGPRNRTIATEQTVKDNQHFLVIIKPGK